MIIVLNNYGYQIDFDAAVQLMDDELRENLNLDLAPCSEQVFFSEYEKRHFAKFQEEFLMKGGIIGY